MRALPAERIVAIQLSDGSLEPRDPDYFRDCLQNRVPTGDGEFPQIPVELSTAAGLIDLCVVARFESEGQVLGLNWIEFPAD